MMVEIDTMRIWNAVKETNPADTKDVDFGRKFTAIDPYSQIEKATQQFGPVGMGWGWSVHDVLFLPTDQVAVVVRMWHSNPNKAHEFFCAVGQCKLFTDNKKEKPDGDCVKKAMTDGITKGLSYLGFNADVFRGRFDDNKYVEEMRLKHADSKTKKAAEDKDKAAREGASKWAKATIGQIDKTADKNELEKFLAEEKSSFQSIHMSFPEIAKTVKIAADKKREELENAN